MTRRIEARLMTTIDLYVDEAGLHASLDSKDFDISVGGFIVIDGNVYLVEGVNTTPTRTILNLKYAGPDESIVETAVAQYQEGDFLTTNEINGR